MEIILSILVFLLAVAVGILALHYLHSRRDAARAIETTERLAHERIAHMDATATVFLRQSRLLAQAILKELRASAKERRTILDLAIGPCLGAPEFEPPHSQPPESDVMPLEAGTSTLPPDAPTPKSGYALSDLLSRSKDSAP